MLHSANIFLHIFMGISAIIIGIFAYSSPKWSKGHKRYGQIFLWMTGIVVLTALNGVLFFVDRPFLTVVTFMTFYMSYSGYRVIKTRNTGFHWIDFMVMLAVAFVALSFIYQIRTATVLWHTGVVYYMLMYLLLVVTFDIFRFFTPGRGASQKFWVYDHIFRMTSSFTGLVSAGMGTVLAAWEPYNQIIPAMLGSAWLIFSLIYFPGKVFKKQAKKTSDQIAFSD